MRSLHKCLALATVLAIAGAAFADDLPGVRGGMKYDKWWAPSGGAPPPGNHPLYPPFGQQSGAATWRCKECHGWDYKGVDGAYGSGSHYTGIRGIYGTTLTRAQLFDLIRNQHGYQGSGLTDADIWDLVEFIQGYLVDTDDYIDPNGQFLGDENTGRFNYQGANGYHTCAHCHGSEATEVRVVADENPWEFLHKVRFGDATGPMPSWILAHGSAQGASDMGRYLQAGLPAPGYAGDQACSSCHADSPTPGFFNDYLKSGHPWKVFRTAGQEPSPTTWPHTQVPPLPVVRGVQLQWSDVEYVIGNFYWKTRFIDRNGYIYTGSSTDKTQWNIATQRWVPYSAGVVNKPFDCGVCHTTGYQPTGNQHGLPGLRGTWAQDGVRCEACHGPSSDHAVHPREMPTPGGLDCADCHYRDAQSRMPWKSGFMEHHQQAEDLAHSPHDGMTCVQCHNPHRSTVYELGGLQGGDCTVCHPGDLSNNYYVVSQMESLECMDCHMPHIGKSAEAFNAYTGDVRGHIFRVMRAPITAAQNVYVEGTTTFWKQNRRSQSFVTLDYACLGCHQQMTIQEASAFADGIHRRPLDAPPPCYADCDPGTGVGALDIFDFLCFQNRFASGDPWACDCDTQSGPGACDIFDFLCFQNAFAAGCP